MHGVAHVIVNAPTHSISIIYQLLKAIYQNT